MQSLEGDRMSKPVVAIVGRPNVGKSTLFNVLAGERISIVQDTPGVTRDRIYAEVSWLDYNFTLIDTGGIEPDSGDIILSQMREQAQIAIDTADVIIFITDVRQGLVDADQKVADMLRRSKKPIILAVNKVDDFKKYMPDVYEFYNLGIGEPIPVSAANRQGLGDMLDEVIREFPDKSEEEDQDDSWDEEEDDWGEEEDYEDEEDDYEDEDDYDEEEDEYVVEGPKIEKMLGYTDLDSEKGFTFFQNFLKDTGILEELEALGIQEGDTVRMYGLSFDYYK